VLVVHWCSRPCIDRADRTISSLRNSFGRVGQTPGCGRLRPVTTAAALPDWPTQPCEEQFLAWGSSRCLTSVCLAACARSQPKLTWIPPDGRHVSAVRQLVSTTFRQVSTPWRQVRCDRHFRPHPLRFSTPCPGRASVHSGPAQDRTT